MFNFTRTLLTTDISYDTITVITDLLKKNNIKYYLRRKIFFEPTVKRSIWQRSSELPVPEPKNQIPNYFLYVAKKDHESAKSILNNLTFKS